MNRTRYLVTYDVCEAKRLRNVYKTVRDFGEHVQYSVFICELDDRELIRLKDRLREHVLESEDQVLVFRLGPANAASDSIAFHLGRRQEPPAPPRVV